MKRLTGNVTTITRELREREWEQDFSDISRTVLDIITDVRKNGDAALVRLTKAFDGVDLTAFKVSDAEIDAAYKSVPDELISALETARKNIFDYHEKQKRSGF
ncbi:histidinol dehydrogenase [Listeria fleischmannii subsp. coloradonensis]|nr:histidinol dehydrogenase [Listeria fleischmannii subsp. coloradonensis]